uniref:Putative salivary glycosidase n=1 Tax=Psorophora albipes TaxID=869069 RepID=T1DFS7_9DIPT
MMKHLLIVLLSSLVVTQAQFSPNTVDRFNQVAASIGDTVPNAANFVPTNPIGTLNRGDVAADILADQNRNAIDAISWFNRLENNTPKYPEKKIL